MLHEKLWELNQDWVQKCLDHPFIQGLGNGSLEQDVFKRYVAQDAFFLDSFVRAYALCAAKCDRLHDARLFHELMGGGFSELQLHASYAKELEIDLKNVEPYTPTLTYTNFLLRTAWERTVGETVAALAPCMQLYGYLGKELAKNPIPNNPYQDWIDTYSGDEFYKLVDQLNELLNRLAEDTQTVQEAYRTAMRCEYEFFAAPLEEKA